MSGKQLLVWLTITSLAATAALAIGVLILGDFGETEGRVLATTLAISVAGLLALPAAVLLEQGRSTVLAGTTIALTAAAFVTFEYVMWLADDSEGGWKTVGTLIAATAASTQISGLTTRLRAGDRQAVRLVYASAVGLVLLIAAMVIAAIWNEIDDGGYYRTLAALAVLNVFLIVVQPLLRKLEPATGAPSGFRIRVATDPGGEEELELSGRDFADAVARAIRKLECDGRRVTRIERR
jgi:hypothetical protein